VTEQEFKDRTKHFALRIIKLCSALPNTVAGRVIANQLCRCGPSVGANYRAACRGRSRADFIGKLAIAEEEADESCFWLELIMESRIVDATLVAALHQEADAITRMLTASRKSAAATLPPSRSQHNQKSKM